MRKANEQKMRTAIAQIAAGQATHIEMMEGMIILLIREAAVCSTQTAIDAMEQAWLESGDLQISRDLFIKMMDRAIAIAKENR